MSVYDGAGQRVAVKSGGVITQVMVYDAAGDLVAEYGGAVSTSGTSYVMGDHQGSTRVVTAGAGAVVSRHDYLPFGEELSAGVGMRTGAQGYSQADGVREKYAGMEGDDSTGMSHTLWREYDSLSARWTAPDPYGGSMELVSPQSFNRYSYVNNDPVNKVDPTGLLLSDIGVVQTTDESYARTLQGASDSAWMKSINSQYAREHNLVIEEEQTRGGTRYSAYQAPQYRTIEFEQLGEINVLCRVVPVYVATGQTQAYRNTVMKNAEGSADLINSNADKLSDEDKAVFCNITLIAAVGVGVGFKDLFNVTGINGDTFGAEGVNPKTGVFYSAQIINTLPKYFAEQIAHEGKHVRLW